VCRGVVGLGGGGVGDVAADDDERGSILHVDRPAQCGLQGVHVLGALTQVFDVPAVGLEAATGVVGQRQLGGAVDRHVVVVVDADQATQAKVSGQGCRLVGDPLGQVAVAGDAERAVIDHLG